MKKQLCKMCLEIPRTIYLGSVKNLEKVEVRLLNDDSAIPRSFSESASGYDLYAYLPGGSVQIGQEPTRIPTGIALAAPPGIDVQIRPRSGLSSKGVLTTFGTVDADYRGELFVTMYAVSPKIRHTVQHGDRIAQLVFSQLALVHFEATESLSDTVRGSGGHGSTGG